MAAVAAFALPGSAVSETPSAPAGADFFLPGSIPTVPLDPRFPVPEGPELAARSAVILDAATGAVLYAKNPDEPIPPASLTKLMTMHLAFQAVERGEARLDEVVALPRASWAVNAPWGSSLMFLAPGQRVTLRELLLGLAVASGNDAAVALAIRLGGSVQGFVVQMNDEAARLGLARTHFVDPSGYSERNITCASDFARFCRLYITLHPQAIGEYHSVRVLRYPEAKNLPEAFRDDPGTVVQQNRNLLLGVIEGVDGLKTGYIPESGYNFAVSAGRGDTRIVAVLLGGPGSSSKEGGSSRAGDGEEALEWAFAHYRTARPAIGLQESLRVWKAAKPYAPLRLGEEAATTIPADRGRGLGVTISLDPFVEAPAVPGTRVGMVIVSDDAGELRRIPVELAEGAEPGPLLARIWDSLRLFFAKLAARLGV